MNQTNQTRARRAEDSASVMMASTQPNERGGSSFERIEKEISCRVRSCWQLQNLH